MQKILGKRGNKRILVSVFCLLLVFTAILFTGCGTVREVDNGNGGSRVPPAPPELVSIEISNYQQYYYKGIGDGKFSTEGNIVIGTYSDATTADVTAQAEYRGYFDDYNHWTINSGTAYTITVTVQGISTTFDVYVALQSEEG